LGNGILAWLGVEGSNVWVLDGYRAPTGFGKGIKRVLRLSWLVLQEWLVELLYRLLPSWLFWLRVALPLLLLRQVHILDLFHLVSTPPYLICI